MYKRMAVELLNTFMRGIYSLNNSKFFAGLIMIFMNVGSKYVTIELSKTQEQYLRNTLARQLLIFSISWFGTHDIFMSLALVAIFHVLTQHLFNENSPFCVIPPQWRELKEFVDKDGDGNVSETELNQAIKVLEKAKEEQRRKKQKDLIDELNQYKPVE